MVGAVDRGEPRRVVGAVDLLGLLHGWVDEDGWSARWIEGSLEKSEFLMFFQLVRSQ